MTYYDDSQRQGGRPHPGRGVSRPGGARSEDDCHHGLPRYEGLSFASGGRGHGVPGFRDAFDAVPLPPVQQGVPHHHGSFNLTPTLYHGPKGRDAAITWASKVGRPISDPVGDGGLKVDDARAIVVMSMRSGIGDRPPTVVIGPMDETTPEASDALLKTLEDLAEGPLRICLWAHHLGEVTPTIRSRTLHTWCPGRLRILPATTRRAEALVSAFVAGNAGAVIAALDEKEEEIGDPDRLLDAVAINLAGRDDGLSLWPRVRRAMGVRWLGSRAALADVFLP